MNENSGYANATTNNEYATLDTLVRTRIQTLAHLQYLHTGAAYYFETVRLSSDAQEYDTPVARKRCWQYKYLGLSVGALLVVMSPVEFVKALNVLILEYENETEAKQVAIKPSDLFRKRRQIHSQDLSNVSTTFLETGVYQYLETPDIPFDLDYCHVFMSLCDALIAAYNKLIDGTEDVCGPGYLQASLRFDILIKVEY
ncbi:hypothetical protein HK100_006916 [Physocladia obscura]|uniref:Uncharacterized protein n=1 Tax=Physocladia obscura TaxID=109957 RepID=A0AAD5SSJ8_9FUNG|nr:hypothetical protein HK100_006916 [Physocladia obscura]